MRKLPAIFVFFLLSTLAIAESNWDAQVAKAREAAAAGKHDQAVAQYRALIKSVGKKDPKAEMMRAELVMVYYAQKDNDKTARECIKFLQSYPQSQFGFNISYVLAAAYFGMERHADAFAIFSGFPFEAVRGLNEDSKGKVYEVLIRSLVGMKKEPASLALRADVNNLLVGADGKPLLTGPIQGIVDLVKTDEELDRLIDQTPSSEKERIYALLNRAPKGTVAEPFVPVFHFGIGGAFDSIASPAVSQIMTQAYLGAELPLTSEGSSIGLKTEFDLLQLSTNTTGEKLRQIRWDMFIRGRLFGDHPQGFLMNLVLGMHYRTSGATGTIYAFQDLIGAYAYPEFRIALGSTTSIGLFGWFVPLAKLKGKLDSHNSILGGGMDLMFQGLFDRPNSVFVNFERTRFRPTVAAVGTELTRFNFGYRIHF